ncbi:hypothetical protein [Botrimarina sp.]|uniref:hypothetical protein n=1 Tax=Botrimarina sp. TaxID=2795802 RepID=UPI0032F01E87
MYASDLESIDVTSVRIDLYLRQSQVVMPTLEDKGYGPLRVPIAVWEEIDSYGDRCGLVEDHQLWCRQMEALAEQLESEEQPSGGDHRSTPHRLVLRCGEVGSLDDGYAEFDGAGLTLTEKETAFLRQLILAQKNRRGVMTFTQIKDAEGIVFAPNDKAIDVRRKIVAKWDNLIERTPNGFCIAEGVRGEIAPH